MKFDALGLPQEIGASDLADSSRLAGIMTVFGWPQKVDLRWYCDHKYTGVYRYVRHPNDLTGHSFSRDQAICLMAGYKVGEYDNYYVNEKYITGKDILWMISGHIKRCEGLTASWFDDLKLWAQVYYHARWTPLDEPNQLLCQMMIADKKFLRYWCNANAMWKRSILDYWFGWRNEPELAALMVATIKGYL